MATVDVMSMIPAENTPREFTMLSDDEKAIRGRYFLMVYAMGASIEYAWFHALDGEPAHSAEMRTVVAGTDDSEIADALANRNVPGRPVLDWTPTP